MRKLISKIAGLMLGLSLVAGVGVALGESKNAEKVSATDSNFTLSSASDVTENGATASFAKGSGGTAPAWYAAGLRLYASNTITISSTDVITAISFNWEKQGTKAFASCSADAGSYTHPSTTGTGSWTGSANQVVFTLGGSGQLQLNTFSVTHSAGTVTPALDTPENLTVSGHTVSWDAVSNNSGYNYSIKYRNNEVDSGTVNTNSLDVSSLGLSEAKYWVTVSAKGDGTNYVDSSESESIAVEYYTTNEVFPSGETSSITLSTTGGTNAYTFTVNGKSALKSGKSTESGSLVLTVPAGAQALTVRLAGWHGESDVVGVTGSVTNLSSASLTLTSDNNLTGSESSINLIASEREYLFTLTFDAVGSDTNLTFGSTSGNRFVLWDAVAYLSSEPVPVTYSVTYDDNAGGVGVSGMPNPSVITGIEPGESHTISSASPVRDGYTFKGWSTTSGDSNIDDKVTGSIVINANTTLYAIWAASAVPTSGSYKYYATTDITSGIYVIAANVGGTYYAMGNEYASKISGSVVTVTDGAITGDVSAYSVTVTVTNDGATIYNGSKYLTYSSSTDLGISSSAYYWTLSTGTHGSTRCLSVNTPARGLFFRAGTTNKYGGYAASNASATSEYYDLEFFRAYTASDYANVFLSNTVCHDGSAPTYGTGYDWSELGTEFTNKLTAEEKAILVAADADKEGTIVEQAVARYDLIVRKYGYDNFMSRTVTSGAPYIQPVTNSNASTSIIVVVALTSITSIGVLLVIKRKRSLVK